MIRYRLRCRRAHEFEGWFSSSADFDRQHVSGLVECPVCGDKRTEKTLMAPAVSTSRRKDRQASENPETGAAEKPVARLASLSAEQRALLHQMREIKRRILASAEDVGPKFPEEARKIHYGESKPRGIYGQASLEDAAELAEEGIEVLPLPDLPQDGN